MEEIKVDELCDKFISLIKYYEKLSSIVKYELLLLLEKNNFKFNSVNSRTKSLESLRLKLTENKEVQNIRDVKQINDLAGCRIIFYLEEDIEKYTALMKEKFEAEPNDIDKDGYKSRHFVVKIKDLDNKTEDCEILKELRCEIQLTCIIWHVWSELEHDIIYKPKKEIKNFDPEALKTIKSMFKDVMDKYLIPANHAFSFINLQFEKLKSGLKIFDKTFLNGITSRKNNHDLYFDLYFLNESIKEFGNKIPEGVDIMQILRVSIECAKTNEPGQLIYYQDKEDKGLSLIMIAISDILTLICFEYPVEVFKLITDHFSSRNNIIKNKIDSLHECLTRYNYEIYCRIGYSIQISILEYIESYSKDEIENYSEIIVKTLKNFLEVTMKQIQRMEIYLAASQGYYLPVNDTLMSIRSISHDILLKIFNITKDLRIKIIVLDTIENSFYGLFRTQVSPDLRTLLINEIKIILKYYFQFSSSLQEPFILHIDKQIKKYSKLDEILNSPEYLDLKIQIESNSNYTKFKIIVEENYYSSENYDLIKAQKEENIIKIINDYTEDDYEQIIYFIKILESYFLNFLIDPFYIFFFLEELGYFRPKLSINIVRKGGLKPTEFLVKIMVGILKSKDSVLAEILILEWIEQGQNLWICANIYKFVKYHKIRNIENLYQKSMEMSDFNALVSLSWAIISNYSKISEVKLILLSIIKHLLKSKKFQRIDKSHPNYETFVIDLTKKEFNDVLKYLLLAPTINHTIDTILSYMAKKDPINIIKYFYRRVIIQNKSKMMRDYEAMPNHFNRLNVVFSSQYKIVIPEIIKYYKNNKECYRDFASNLFNAIFQNFDSKVESELIELIKERKKEEIDSLLWLLENYHGEKFIHNVIKEIIVKTSRREPIREVVFRILSRTKGMERSLSEAYQKKINDIDDWQNDTNQKIRTFYKDFSRYVVELIKNHQRLEEKRKSFEKMEYDYYYKNNV